MAHLLLLLGEMMQIVSNWTVDIQKILVIVVEVHAVYFTNILSHSKMLYMSFIKVKKNLS